MITKTELFDVTYDRVFRGPPDLPPLVGTLAALPTHVQQCIIAYGEAVRAQARAEMRAEMVPVAWTKPAHKSWCGIADPGGGHCDCGAKGQPLAVIPKE